MGREYQNKFRNSEYGKEKVRLYRLKKKYNVTEEEYENMLIAQENKCAICLDEFTSNSRHIQVDHCHNTKEVRGILCGTCNRGLGQFKDNPDLLKKAAAYLEKV